MTRETGIQLAALYGPLAGSALLAAWRRPSRRESVGLLFSFAWVTALLPWFDSLARAAGLWEFHFHGPGIAGLPLALYLGWAIAWGIGAPLVCRALGGRVWATAALFALLDLRLMPEMEPVLMLHPAWLAGEIAVVAGLLVPALFLSEWTAAGVRTGLRCGMLAPAFGGIFLGIPLLLECGGLEEIAARWDGLSRFSQAGFATAGIAFSVLGLTALRDLALSGGGTPVPLDPPRRLVTHGVYAFVRNPMQLSMTALLVLESAFIPSPWPAVMAVLGMVYSVGFARWSEGLDMPERFGGEWEIYRQRVHCWWPRWRPAVGQPCELWLDDGCGPCAEVADWFRRRDPAGLEIRAAEDFPGPPLTRATWRHPASGRTEAGVRAVAMALQHLDLRWAAIGWLAGLPGISHLLQACMDAAGAGPLKRRPAFPARAGRRSGSS